MVFCTGRQWRAFFLACFFFLTTLTAAHGSTQTLLFNHIDEANGLPDSTVFQVMQDREGAMWFGTRNGVARYDGVTMKVLQNEAGNPQSLSHNDSGGVLEDPDGSIWLRTWGGGLNRLDPETGNIQRFQHDPLDPQSLSEDRVQSDFIDSHGILWAGTFGKGLNRFDQKTGGFTHYLSDDTPGAISHNRVWSISETRDQVLWVGTDQGLNRLNREKDTFTVALPNERIRALHPAGGGTLWVGTQNGFHLFDPEKGGVVPFPGMETLPPEISSGPINTLYEDGRTLWVGTQNHGLLILDLETGHSTLHQSVPYLAHSLSHNDIRWITQDRAGVIWIATRGGGINTLSKTCHQMKLFMPGYSGDHIPLDIHAVAADDDENLWFGSWYTGLKKTTLSGDMSEATGNVPPPRGPGSLDINALALGPTKDLWIGTWGNGLIRRAHQTAEYTRMDSISPHPDNRIFTALSEKKAGILWAGTRNQGLFRHDLKTGQVTRFTEGPSQKGGLSSNTINDLLEDDSDNLWVGTNLGLNRIAEQGGRVSWFHKRKEAAESLSHNVITGLAQTPNGDIWVGTYHGLNRLDPETETIRTYFMEDGLSGNVIKSLIFDGSRRLWVATDKGLSAIDLKNDTISRFPLPLRFVQGAVNRSKRGEVIFGAKNGYLVFSPEEIPLTLSTAPLYLTGLSLNGSPIQPGIPVDKRIILSKPLNKTDRIELKHTENNLTVSFALHDYSNPAENRYRFRLKGYDTTWVEAGNSTTARYSHLPPGSYRFQVMAAGSHGAWSQSHTGLEIHIATPFWERGDFRAAICLFAAGLIWLRITFTRKRTRELKHLVTLRTQELEEQSRHHEALSLTDPLTELLNRKGLQKRQKELHSQARRNQTPYALILADIDHFKSINDTCGHDCGDFVLQQISTLFYSNQRTHDILGRWRGGKFILLLPDTNEKGARILAERMRDRIAASLFEWNGVYLTVTVTIGGVTCALDETFEQSLSKANAALYTGKKRGRNQVVVTSPE
ncbi:ligand-binding sensor domain-containing diguanylate cyclase [Desulfoluna sp.]|uniref:ligand-binding sensor domain-containing protein n=1 Tax=Desulfoluna sp. TaxID=2045199 RepID=UPI002625FAC8|nr:ligand-binding sensor domain-containing diguanylate cyclase [Desulfoluna sp.]